MLKIRFKDNKYNAVWLVESQITIGRSATNALVVEDPAAADVHLEVQVDNENLTLKNLVPERPVSVNDIEVSGACELLPDDIIRIGATELIVVDPKRESRVQAQEASNATQLRPTSAASNKPTGWSLKANHAALANRVFALRELTVIGRASECDICLGAAHLSRRHAQLQVVDGMLYVKDLGSANGTFLNGKAVTEARVKRGDELRFDSLSFGVLGPADDLAKTTVRKQASNIPERAEPISKSERDKLLEAKARAAARAMQEPVVRASSHAAGEASGHKVDRPGSKGRFGLIFIGVLAAIIVAALFLTRR